MILPIVKYGNPILRQKGVRIEAVTPEIDNLIADMLETMESANGVGLAAQQIGRALQLAVIDITGVEDRPSTLERDGKPSDPEAFMPLVLINPEVTPVGTPMPGAEGCLSCPEVYTDIIRPESVDVVALNQKGERVAFRCGGLLARAVQHETDHLNGILFIDRMSTADRAALRSEIEAIQKETRKALKKA